ncbi:MAG: DUF4160 domain-containing protein [Prevotellaceae bacterium]|jgi:hypothetical protein|nr:DUF4160 domain-containing protein [Prevotellaceae bacterium]
MPTIYEYLGFIFKFYSNEHYPIHVHVIRGELESIFDLVIVDGNLIEVRKRAKRGKKSLSVRDSGIVEEFLLKYWKNITDKWISYFVYNVNVRCTKITKKVK